MSDLSAIKTQVLLNDLSAAERRAEAAERLLQEMTEYALDITRALIGLSGGGSEMFSGQIGNIFKADIDRCCRVVRDRHDKMHELLVRAVKSKNVAEAHCSTLAEALERFEHDYTFVDQILINYRNREVRS